MSSNPGKRFEEDFKASVPDGVYLERLKDAGGWAKAPELRFTPKNPYDHLLYSRPDFFALELKSVAGSRWPYASLSTTQRNGLLRASRGGAVAGVLLNFREVARTFFFSIQSLLALEQSLGKKSLNVTDAAKNGYELRQQLVRTRTRYDVQDFINAFRR